MNYALFSKRFLVFFVVCTAIFFVGLSVGLGYSQALTTTEVLLPVLILFSIFSALGMMFGVNLDVLPKAGGLSWSKSTLLQLCIVAVFAALCFLYLYFFSPYLR
jgi:hypothetical protein